MMNEIFKCSTCGLEFYSKYWEGGSIDHENTERNIGHYLNVFREGSEKDKEECFLKILGLHGNLCNIKGTNKNTSLKKLNCVCIGFETLGAKKESEELKSFSVDKAFNVLYDMIIKEKESEIKSLKEGIIGYREMKVKI